MSGIGAFGVRPRLPASVPRRPGLAAHAAIRYTANPLEEALVMAIERARVCGACERECPDWANRCPACGSLSLLHRIIFVPAAPQPGASLGARPGADPVSHKPARKGATRPRTVAARDAKVRTTPFAGEPETRAV